MKNWILQRLAVGSSDWLGPLGVTDWRLWWRLRCLELAMLAEVAVLCICARILIEAYCEYKQDKREDKNPDGKSNQPPRKNYDPPSGNLGKLRSRHKYLGLTLRNLCVGVDVCRAKSCDFLLKALNFCLKGFRRLAHRPNENKLSDRHRERAWLRLKLF